jgi:hypothetical protein
MEYNLAKIGLKPFKFDVTQEYIIHVRYQNYRCSDCMTRSSVPSTRETLSKKNVATLEKGKTLNKEHF